MMENIIFNKKNSNTVFVVKFTEFQLHAFCYKNNKKMATVAIRFE